MDQMFGRNERLTVCHVRKLAAGLKGGEEMVDLVKNLVMRRVSDKISQEVYESEWNNLPERQRDWLARLSVELRGDSPMIVMRKELEKKRVRTVN